MKFLPLIALLLMVSCGNKSSDHKKKKSNAGGISFVLVNSSNDNIPGLVAEESSSEEPSGDNTDDNNEDPSEDTTEDTIADNSGEDTEDSSGDSTEETSPLSTNSLICNFSNENDQKSFLMKLREDSANKQAMITQVNGIDKAIFDGFILNPSGNEQSAIKHVDKNFSIEEGKIIKIMARVVFDKVSGIGELQLRFRVKQDNNEIIETDYRKLADIDNCSEQE